ncbi:MAG: hypothetical protein AMXMBFR82_07170 [Candidatus Hydrogenedentota bacterium]
MSNMNKEMLLPKWVPGIVKHDLGSESFLHDEQNERIHVLNCTASLIWDHCDGHTSYQEMLGILLREFSDVTVDVLRIDLGRALKEFAERGVVMTREQPCE